MEVTLTKIREVTFLIEPESLPVIEEYPWYLGTKGYIIRPGGGSSSSVQLHRQLMDCPDDMDVDHLNHNKLDNRISNLMITTHVNNSINQPKRKKNTSKYYGVYIRRRDGKYITNASIAGNTIYIGAYDDELEAADAYDYYVVKNNYTSKPINFPDKKSRIFITK